MKEVLFILFIALWSVTLNEFVVQPKRERAKQVDTVESKVVELDHFKEIKVRRTSTIPNDFNNPLSIRLGNNDKINQYAIGWCWTKGKSNGKFLVFPDPQNGFFAGYELLTDFDSTTLNKFFRKYAPAKENDTKAYLVSVCNQMGADTLDYVVDYKNELLYLLAKKEGFNRW